MWLRTELLIQTFRVAVNGFGVADTFDDSQRGRSLRVVAILALFMYTSTATFVATLRVGTTEVKESLQIRFMPKWLVLLTTHQKR